MRKMLEIIVKMFNSLFCSVDPYDNLVIFHNLADALNEASGKTRKGKITGASFEIRETLRNEPWKLADRLKNLVEKGTKDDWHECGCQMKMIASELTKIRVTVEMSFEGFKVYRHMIDQFREMSVKYDGPSIPDMESYEAFEHRFKYNALNMSMEPIIEWMEERVSN